MTQEDILIELNTEADKYPELANLQANTSNLSWWASIKKVFAFSSLTLQNLFDQHKKEVLGLVLQDYNVGSKEWYKMQCYGFQFGYKLQIVNNVPTYPVQDDTAKIISKASVKENITGGLILKVNKVVGGNLEALTATELDAFSNYMAQVKIAGTLIKINSYQANVITINARVILNNEVFKPNGTHILTGEYKVLNAIKAFIQSNVFDEYIYISDFMNAIRSVDGVKGCYINAIGVDGVVVDLTQGKFQLPNGYGKITESDNDFNLRMTYELV
ncbi:MAG: hypothetical protein K2Q03_05690 [Sphingobacteriaceae bacterium]|nr:hypothetical protein [Sphingobacteriaceae bacterium]